MPESGQSECNPRLSSSSDSTSQADLRVEDVDVPMRRPRKASSQLTVGPTSFEKLHSGIALLFSLCSHVLMGKSLERPRRQQAAKQLRLPCGPNLLKALLAERSRAVVMQARWGTTLCRMWNALNPHPRLPGRHHGRAKLVQWGRDVLRLRSLTASAKR